LLVLALLVGGGALGASLLGDDPSAPATDTTDPSDSTDSSPDGAASSPDNDSGSSDSGTQPEQAATGSREDFVSDYYAGLPDDTESGWSMLSPGFQREVGSYQDYDGFWSTIDSVTVEDVEAVGPDAVDTTLVYTTDGSSQREVRRIELTESDGSYLISGDEVVG
jgi:hypothetical protein